MDTDMDMITDIIMIMSAVTGMDTVIIIIMIMDMVKTNSEA